MAKVLRLPPRIKVLEALGSIADGRISVQDDGAEVTSSTGERTYKVIVRDDGRVYSTDNGTIYRGYIGYPIIALLMVKGKLPYDERIAKALSGIPWKRLNETYRKYVIVEQIVLKKAEEKGVPRQVIMDFVNIVMKKLQSMKLVFDEDLVKQKTLF